MEDLPTTDDKPHEEVMIASAGILSTEDVAKEEEARKSAQESASAGGDDVWEDYPVDEEGVDVDKPEETLGVATKLKDIGTK